MRKHYTNEQRAELVRLVLDEALSLRRAAARLDVADSTAYHWVKRAAAARGRTKGRPRPAVRRRLTVQRPPLSSSCAPRRTAASSAFALGAATVEVGEGFDAKLLRQVVVALAEAAQ